MKDTCESSYTEWHNRRLVCLCYYKETILLRMVSAGVEDCEELAWSAALKRVPQVSEKDVWDAAWAACSKVKDMPEVREVLE